MSTNSTNTLGKYQIVREIGRSNDIVYEAIDPTINRRIALKELSIPPNVTGAQRRERIERFWREGKAAGKLSHPNIVTIYEVGKDGDRHFIAMEFLEGQTLRDMLQAGGPLPIKDAVSFALQLCSALAYAHQNGVIHRDIKPENVQVLPGGLIKLTDFGIARLMGEPSITQDGQVFGTPSYMSPEQVSGKSLDARSDLFSLGVVLYEMVAGHKPFSGDSIVTITYNIMNMEAPPIPGAPPYIVGIVRKAMAKDPNMRYSTADEMAQDLRDEKAPGQFMHDQTGYGGFPSPFGGASQGPFQQQNQFPSQGPFPPQQQGPFSPPPGQYSPSPSPFPPPQGPMTPYGTPMPSPNAGASPDPFAPIPQSVPQAPSAPPQPIMSSETRNFLGVFLLVLGCAGMLLFAIWAVNLAFTSYQISVTSEHARRYYDQGMKLYKAGDSQGAVDQWVHAINVSPKSQVAEEARNRIYEVAIVLAKQYYEQANYAALKRQGQSLITSRPNKPEGHFYLAYACQSLGDNSQAKSEYELAIKHGGNDDYAQYSRSYVGRIYLNEGDGQAAIGHKDAAIAAYEKAKELGDTNTLQAAQDRIDKLNYGQ